MIYGLSNIDYDIFIYIIFTIMTESKFLFNGTENCIANYYFTMNFIISIFFLHIFNSKKKFKKLLTENI